MNDQTKRLLGIAVVAAALERAWGRAVEADQDIEVSVGLAPAVYDALMAPGFDVAIAVLEGS